jgi:LPXTG-site transpeptidase (sortase) family protein
MSPRFPASTAGLLLALALALTACQGSTREAGPPAPTVATTPTAPEPTPTRPERPSRAADVPVRPAVAEPSAEVAVPTRVDVADLDVTIAVEPVGVADDGQMVIPPDANVAGWYEFGPPPGSESGTSVIAAHVDSIASGGLGPFARLADLEPGGQVSTTDADGRTTTFDVVSVEMVAKSDITWHDVFTREGDPRLVLITCGGSWDSAAAHYSDNVLVTAVPSP